MQTTFNKQFQYFRLNATNGLKSIISIIITAFVLLLFSCNKNSSNDGGNNNSSWSQQGNKLVGIGAIGNAGQGSSISISADGNSLIFSGYTDNNNLGAAWIFTRANGAWGQQGNKLVGSGAIGNAGQGSVAISSDGNTAIVGGANDNNSKGAVWVFVRSNGIWIPQGSKLLSTGGVSGDFLGASVALSSDGNTAVVSGYNGNNVGATWVFIRSNGIWTQQGGKLVGTGAVGNSNQGIVSVSGDGNTFVTGGFTDNNNTGAAWIFTRSSGVWSQQGNKLVGTGAIGNAYQGQSVAISLDGNNVVIGGSSDNNSSGAAWVFARTNGVWTQQGNKLVGTDATANSSQGRSVSINSDGNTIVIGSTFDNSGKGAARIFTRSNGSWTQQGSKLVGTGNVGNSSQGISVAVNSDGTTIAVGGYGDDGQKGAAWVFKHL